MAFIMTIMPAAFQDVPLVLYEIDRATNISEAFASSIFRRH